MYQFYSLNVDVINQQNVKTRLQQKFLKIDMINKKYDFRNIVSTKRQFYHRLINLKVTVTIL